MRSIGKTTFKFWDWKVDLDNIGLCSIECRGLRGLCVDTNSKTRHDLRKLYPCDF